MNKVIKILLIVVFSLTALLLLVTLLASPVAKSYINHHSEQLIGRRAELQRLRINPLGGRVKLCKLTIYENDGTSPFMAIDTFDVKVRLRALLHRELNVRHLVISGLKATIIQNGNQFNFASIIDHFSSDDTTEVDTTASKPWDLGFYNIRLSHCKLRYNDVQRGSKWDVKDINLEVPGVYFSGRKKTNAGLNLSLADGGELGIQLNYNIESNDFDLGLNIASFDLANAKPYCDDFVRLSALKGKLDASFQATGNLSHLLNMTLQGTLTIVDLSAYDIEREPFASVARLHVDVNDIDLGTNRFNISKISIEGLDAVYTQTVSSSNFARLTVPKEAAEATDSTATPIETQTADSASKQPMQLLIKSFLLTQSSFTYNDLTLPDPFRFPITNMELSATDVTLSSTNTAHFKATLPGNGRATIDWRGRIDNWKESQHIDLAIRNLKLQQLSPYSVAYLGQPFTDGTFSFSSQTVVQHSLLNSENHIDMYRPEVGQRRKDVDSALHIPLKAALYVLKDKDDRVVIDLPISGNLRDPKFSYMKAVWQTLRNLLVKVTTSPIRAIGNSLGMKSDELDFIDMDSTQTEFTSKQYYQMDQLAKLLQSDTSVLLILEQQLPSPANEAQLERTEALNQKVKQHMSELGISDRQLIVRNATEQPKRPRAGYTISSQLRPDRAQ
ncbi:MAG: DUF748 domain-containing protein [Bacteroidales bacterium]|nr:DUF748 domain-containing protein [Bacteroidales bacterium]